MVTSSDAMYVRDCPVCEGGADIHISHHSSIERDSVSQREKQVEK